MFNDKKPSVAECCRLFDDSGFYFALDIKRCGFDPWVEKIPWRSAWQPTPVFLPGKSHGHRNLASYSPMGLQRVGYSISGLY